MRGFHRPGDASEHLRQDVNAIKDDLSLLRSDLVAAFRDLIAAGRTGAGGVRATLLDAVQDRIGGIGNVPDLSELGDRGRRAVSSAQRYAKENPLRTAAIAAGVVGLVIGAAVVMKRR